MSERSKPVTIGRLALANLKRKPFRTAGLVLLSAVLAFVLFAGVTLTASLSNGLNSIGSRFGADLIVVPQGSDDQMKGIILQGNPSLFYMDRDVLRVIEAVEGVAQVSPQFFLTSVGADCCEMPVQIIGFDPETDFTVQPWIREVYADTLKDGELIIGSDIEPYNNGTVRFYNTNYPVASQLAQTGTGLDQAVYGNWDTLIGIFGEAKRQGLGNIPNRDPEKSLSSVLIRVEDGADPLLVSLRIQQAVDGVSVVRTQSMLSGIADSLRRVSGFLYAFIILFALTALFTLTIVFSVTAGERKREFALLRIFGLTRRGLSRLLLLEAALISGIGALAGTALAALLVVPFSTAIGSRLGLPYLAPAAKTLLLTAAVGIGVTLAFGPLAASGTARRISRAETYLVLREGE